MLQQSACYSTISSGLCYTAVQSMMLWYDQLLFLLIVFSLTLVHVQPLEETDNEGCQFCYSKQPLTSVEDCNPYGISPILTCQVQGTKGAVLEIKWFFESQADGTKTELVNNNDHNIQTSYVTTSTININSQMRIINLAAGKYWCQVYHNNNGLLQSQKFDVAENGDYSRYESCLENASFSEQKEKCADVPLEDGSTSCPSIDSKSTIKSGFTTTTLIPSITVIPNTSQQVTATATVVESQAPSSQTTMPLMRSTTRSESTVVISTGSIPTVRPTNDPAGLENEEKTQTWLYVVAGLSGTFLFLIIVLKGVCILLCLTTPHTKRRKRRQQAQFREKRLDTLTSPVTTDPPSRPLTTLTMQTDIIFGGLPNMQESSSMCDSCDQDYEDIDDEGKDIELTAGEIPMCRNPRYHEQGPTTVNLQPIYTIPTMPTQSPQYSEIGSPTRNDLILEGISAASLQTHGYGKLDHSRPRQHYNPRIDSPLLSGYRKLDHVRLSSRATTLPHVIVSPGYANIDIPNPTGCHFRSVSLPSSEYSNLNPNTMSQPTTPNAVTPSAVTPTTASKKYSNFEIIENWDGENSEAACAPDSRRVSEDYHMLADATIDRTDDELSFNRDEYEFLPVCMCEDDLLKIPDHFPFQFSQEVDNILKRKGINSFGRELIDEKMSVTSNSSEDFTGPFIFPHMANFGRNVEQERHVYRALDLSTMEPQKGYAVINVKDDNV